MPIVLASSDCSEGFWLNYPTGVYDIQPLLATSPFSVMCKMWYGGRTHILMRKKPYLLFNRTWDEYRNGFGNLSEDHWLGLEQIYLLTNSFSDVTLKVQIKKHSLHSFQQFYYNFRVSDEASLYCLNFSFSTPNSDKQKVLGDSLKPGLGAPFSTFDRDNDGDVTARE
ncbi:techylectin-5B-like [Littorina saxatilis]|uniref:techylectin-5B-like n=1 Tax=Littorina saxatilis TaxID=31220 RepID=UPI0038B42092